MHTQQVKKDNESKSAAGPPCIGIVYRIVFKGPSYYTTRVLRMSVHTISVYGPSRRPVWTGARKHE